MTYHHSFQLIVRGTVLALSVALAGCSLAPTYERPTAPIPSAWERNVTDGQSRPLVEAPLDWQRFIVSDRLRDIVALALAHNRNLRQAVSNMEAARAQYGVQRADRLPAIGLAGSMTRQRTPADVSPAGTQVTGNVFQANVAASAFELDLFGRVRNLSEAAFEEYLATAHGVRNVQLNLIYDVANAYLMQSSAQQRNALTSRTLAVREESLQLLTLRERSGTASALEYQEAVGLVEQARAEQERTAREVAQARNALTLLTGMQLGAAVDLTADVGPLFADVDAGLPSSLLEWRPDVLAAESRLRGRNASIGAARAAFFPNISLTGAFGSSSTELSNLFSSGSGAWQFMPQISLPIFSGGRNVAGLDLATARRDEAVAAYEGTVQNAFTEVADALAARRTLAKEVQARAALAASTAETLRLSKIRYEAGIDGQLQYLDAQRRSFADQLSLIEVRTQERLAVANLYKSIGGGSGGGSEGDLSAAASPPG